MNEQVHILSTKLLQPETKALLPAWVNYSEVEAIKQSATIGEVIANRLEQITAMPVLFIFSSVTAVEAINALYKTWPFNWSVAFVGLKTKSSFKTLYPQAHSIACADSAEELARELTSEQEACDVIYCCGNRHLPHLPSLLRAAKFLVTELVVYNTTLQPFSIASPVDAVLFFSPSAVESFFSQHKLEANTLCVANGNTTAASLRAYNNDLQVMVSYAPGQLAVMQTLLRTIAPKNFQQQAI